AILSASHATTTGLFCRHDPATTAIYSLSLHDALPIFLGLRLSRRSDHDPRGWVGAPVDMPCVEVDVIDSRGPTQLHDKNERSDRSEEHTSELQSRENLVCRLLLEKKKKQTDTAQHAPY